MNLHRPFTALALVVTALMLGACHGGLQRGAHTQGDTVAMAYAKRLTIVKHDGYTRVDIANPWKKGQTLHTYLLVPRTAEVPADLPEGTLIRTPLQRAVVFTSVHCGLFDELGHRNAVAGVADLKYIKIPFVQEGCRKGTIADVGNGLNPVLEKVIDINADALLLSPFENNGGYGGLEDIGIPIVECADYMETSPLGRAEWIRFYGMLLGEEARADSLFHAIEGDYLALKARAAKANDRPVVLMDKLAGTDVWYVPGGRSTIGLLLRDANCRYPYADDTHSGSLALTFETILTRFEQADVWLLRFDADHAITRQELGNDFEGYRQMRPYKADRVYGCNVMLSMFYEETPFHPERLLREFVNILHPELDDGTPLRYYFKLKNP